MCWPILMSGNDIVGIAQTGSGKTLGVNKMIRSFLSQLSNQLFILVPFTINNANIKSKKNIQE
jgi:superfamily II DNA/RNA helicase